MNNKDAASLMAFILRGKVAGVGFIAAVVCP